ncbi:phage antirepressor KilAC domain-containing protein [Ectopseudomonas mendocina]|nr:phage antirepressor KilAC domain-containing protein [Pseudomonas mendocina]
MGSLILPSTCATMSSLEIAELVGSRHDNVRVTIQRLADKGVIALPAMQEKPTAGRPTQVFVFSGEQGKRDSIVVVAQLSPEFTASLVDRWQELESQLAKPRELSRLELIQMALESEQEKLRLEEDKRALEHRIEEDAPRVAFAKQVEVSEGSISVAQAAKILGTGRQRLFAFLRQAGWVTRKNEPYQSKIEAGYLDVKLGSWEHPDHGVQQSVTALVTGKGLVKLRALWAQRHLWSG